MSFDPSFQSYQGTDYKNVAVTDTSTGADAAIASMRVSYQLTDSTYLGQNGAISDSPIYFSTTYSEGVTISVTNIMLVPYATNTQVDWLNSGGTVLYSSNQSNCFEEGDEQFMYSLIADIAANNSLLQNNSYIYNCYVIAMFTEFAVKAVETGNSIANSQMLLDFAQNMVNNQNDFW